MSLTEREDVAIQSCNRNVMVEVASRKVAEIVKPIPLSP